MSVIFAHPKFARIKIRIDFELSRIQKLGLREVIYRLFKKIMLLPLVVALLPVALLFFSMNFRCLLIFTDRIGHLAIEPDSLLKAQALGLVRRRKWFVIAPGRRVANQHMLHYWEKHFIVIRSNLACVFFNCLSWWRFMRFDASIFVNNSSGSQLAFEINKLWGDRKPILKLTSSDDEFLHEQLAKMGLPRDAWFACVHAREGGFSTVDEVLHSHRNGSIENLIPAIEEITRRGGWVIRLGDPTMKPLKQMPMVVDYAYHPLKSPRLDVVLCAGSRFILGNTSGVFLVGTVFGVPSVLANMIPMPTLGFLKQDLSIPKLLWDKKNVRFLSFQEVMNSPVSTYRYASLYEKNEIIPVENSPDDILDVVIEMMEKLDNKYTDQTDDQYLHDSYMALIGAAHYSYGAASRVSTNFLRRYNKLLISGARIDQMSTN